MSLPPLNSQQQVWLLLPYVSSQKMRLLFSYCQNPIVHWLFTSTVLEEVKNQGPAVVNITDSKLYQDYQQQPEKWQGHIIYTQASQTELLSHLRALLVVRFYGQEKGVLNYYHPQVASYFFQMPESQLSYWLGPIDLFAWYGGSYLALANQQEAVHHVLNPLPVKQRQAFQAESALTPEQEQLLGECQAQYELNEWCCNHGVPYTEGWNYQQEGLRLGFYDDSLTNYIALRAKNPTQAIPTDFPIESNAEYKLSLLKNNWETSVAN